MDVPAPVRVDRLIRLAVRVTPRGGRDAVEGWMLDEAGRPVLRLRISAAAAEGAANAAVVELIARRMKVPKSAVRIANGATARVKRLEIDAEAEDLVHAFGNPGEDQLL